MCLRRYVAHPIKRTSCHLQTKRLPGRGCAFFTQLIILLQALHTHDIIQPPCQTKRHTYAAHNIYEMVTKCTVPSFVSFILIHVGSYQSLLPPKTACDLMHAIITQQPTARSRPPPSSPKSLSSLHSGLYACARTSSKQLPSPAVKKLRPRKVLLFTPL